VARIAIVNDDTDFLSLMAELLRERGWEAIICREAEGAFHRVKETQPDLVVLDVRMSRPESGWMILELLTLDPETGRIPVIVCSAALDDLRSKEAWLNEHGIAILPKPFDIDDLYQAVDSALLGQTPRSRP
jgi:CheY-like chemotaxis protein